MEQVIIITKIDGSKVIMSETDTLEMLIAEFASGCIISETVQTIQKAHIQTPRQPVVRLQPRTEHPERVWTRKHGLVTKSALEVMLKAHDCNVASVADTMGVTHYAVRRWLKVVGIDHKSIKP